MAFSFLGRDFYNALSEKDVERFYGMIVKWLVALTLGIPVSSWLRDYYLSLLQLEWREWMTTRLTRDYLSNQAFYRMQTDVLIDNPDQRISSDIRCCIGPRSCLLLLLLKTLDSSPFCHCQPPAWQPCCLLHVHNTLVGSKLKPQPC